MVEANTAFIVFCIAAIACFLAATGLIFGAVVLLAERLEKRRRDRNG